MKVKLVLVLVLLGSLLAMPVLAYERSIGIGIPYTAFKQEISPELAYDLRGFYWDGKLQVGGRIIYNLTQGTHDRTAAAVELDYLAFSRNGLAGSGYFFGLPLIYEHFFQDHLSWTADMSPGILYLKEGGLNLARTDFMIALTLGINYYF